jgi:hypothetical protein
MFCTVTGVREKKVLLRNLLGQVSVAVRRIASNSKERPISRLENSSGGFW